MRTVVLNTLSGGINRLRIRGGASPNVLYDLENGHVTAANTVESRPGTVSSAILPAGTKGLCAFGGKLHVFATSVIAPGNALYVVNILRHPTTGFAGTLREIHFAQPFLGYLYVVAEFSDGAVYHYWLQPASAWTANTAVKVGDIRAPSVANGFVYEAVRLSPAAPLWAPDVVRAVNNVVEPTIANGFAYTVTSTIGSAPRSGTTEPTWPKAVGATVYEDTGRESPPPTPPPDGGAGTPPADIVERYRGSYRDDVGTFLK